MSLGNPDPNAHPLERLNGSVDRVTFHSEETGFCVLRVKVRGQRDLATVIGAPASVTVGEHVECLGNWVNDRIHGMQFKASRLAVVAPSSVEGIEKYLGSGMQGHRPALRQASRAGLRRGGVRDHRAGTEATAGAGWHWPKRQQRLPNFAAVW